MNREFWRASRRTAEEKAKNW